MNIAVLTLFVSLVLATLAVVLFAWAVRRGEPEHAERLALLPLDDDAVPRTDADFPSPSSTVPTQESP